MSARTATLAIRLTTEEIVVDSLTSSDWIRAGAILVGTIVIAILTNRILRRLISHGIGSGFAAIITTRLIAYLIFLIGLFYSLTSLGVRVGPLLGALGLGGLVLALALQKLVENFIAAIILQARRPFTIGDTVRLDDHLGVVADIDSRTTVLIGLDGTSTRIPNSNVVSSAIVNLTRNPVRRSSLEIGVAYDTDLQLATRTIEDALARVPRVRTDPRAAVTVTGFGDSSIGINVLYWHGSDIPAELATRHDVVIAIHQAFAAANITIAFPQLTMWRGEPGGGNPYADLPSEVHTVHPGLDEKTSQAKRRARQLRRPKRVDPAKEAPHS
jgi:small-conductance mechanosensitive channel